MLRSYKKPEKSNRQLDYVFASYSFHEMLTARPGDVVHFAGQLQQAQLAPCYLVFGGHVACMDASRDARTDPGVRVRQIAALYPAFGVGFSPR